MVIGRNESSEVRAYACVKDSFDIPMPGVDPMDRNMPGRFYSLSSLYQGVFDAAFAPRLLIISSFLDWLFELLFGECKTGESLCHWRELGEVSANKLKRRWIWLGCAFQPLS
jgi:hypothetical protein